MYEHFGGKVGIYLACIRRIRAELEDGLTAAADGATSLSDMLERGATVLVGQIAAELGKFTCARS